MKQLTPLVAPLVMSSSPSWFRPPSPPSQFRPPSTPSQSHPLSTLSRIRPPYPPPLSRPPSDPLPLLASVVYVGDTSFISKRWYPADCNAGLCCSVSLHHPLIQVLSQRLSNLMLMVVDEMISWVWYLEPSYGLFLSPFTAVCSPDCVFGICDPFTAVCSPFTAVCSPLSVVFKSFQLWQLNGLMSHISTHHEKRVFLDVHCPVSSVMEFVPLPMSSSTLCDFVAGSIMLKIRDTSNTGVLIKGFQPC